LLHIFRILIFNCTFIRCKNNCFHFISVDSSCEEAEDFLEKRQIETYLEKSLRNSTLITSGNKSPAHVEFLLPLGLLNNVAETIWLNSNNEPCGARGCLLYLHLEEKASKTQTKSRLLAKVPFDRYTVATFEIHVTFRAEESSWTSKLPHFFR